MDKEILDSYLKAGKIAKECLQFGAGLIKPGVLVVEVCDKVEEKIQSMGGGIAFPAQVAINNVAAHFCPTEDDTTSFKEGDVCSLDIGVHINGYVADTATTVDLGDNASLVQASRDALDAALALVKPGVPVNELGRAIHKAITARGFSPIKNLSGHGLDQYTVHTSPTIPNFDTGHKLELKDGMVFAIEPFATDGGGSIFESNSPTVFGFVRKKGVRSPYARALLSDIEKYNGLPFTTRWLSRKHGIAKTNFGLRELIKQDIIREYPPLVEIKDGIVSQAEHSVLIHDGKVIVYTLKSSLI
ncbi:MAG: type II methionyl aminopeptidase [Nanoarchaeota archaeon]|nr:type II methionyl aminopeptidase [Nanoarchaeota archaeon]